MPDPASARGLATGVLLLALVAAMAPPARAVSAIPDEGAIRLDGDRIRAAIVSDVDGDGVRELVRLAPWSINSGYQAVGVISIAAGEVISHGDALVERAATPDDTFAGRRPSAENLLPLRADEPARLIAWRESGRERVLVASIGAVGLPRPCCLTLWHVSLDGGETALTFIQDTVSSAASILAADLDGDGTDELVVVETPDPALQQARLERKVMVLRWNGADFDRILGTADLSAASGPLLWLGDSDGLPGNEVGFVEMPRFDQVTPVLYRVRLDDSSEVVIEHGILPHDGEVVALDRDDGDRLALVAGDGVSLLSWPSGAPKPLATGFSTRGGGLLGVVGSGPDTAILVRRGGAVDVLDANLVSRVGITVGIAAAAFVGDTGGMEPYVGPLPAGGPDGSAAAYLFAGRLIGAQPDDDTRTPGIVFVRNVATLAGTAPIGLFGPDLAWAATASGGAVFGERSGGLMEVVPGGVADVMWVVPANQLLAPELDGGNLEPRLDGAVIDRTRRVPSLLTGGEVTARLVVPPGSAVHASAVSEGDVQVVDEVAAAGPPPDGQPLQILRSNTDGAGYSVHLKVVTPAGHAYAARWEARVVRRAPQLTVQAPFAGFALDVEIGGRTDPGSAVTVDGEPAAVDRDGSFSVRVPAGLVPRTVTLRAVDQLGNTAEASVSVVAPLDYRQLPWVPITAGLTILAALVLYLRAPRSRQAARAADGGTLEEIE